MLAERRLRRPVIIGLAFLFAGVLFWWSLFALSRFNITQPDIVAGVLAGGEGTPIAKIVNQIRLPRALAAALIGAMLGLCGLIMQGITRNRLASPSILGVTAGAGLGIAVVTSGILGTELPIATAVAAMLGGGAACLLVFLLGAGWSEEASRSRLVLAGITVAALCISLTRLVLLLAEESAQGVMNWLAGSLANVRWAEIYVLAPLALGGLILAIIVAPKLNIINLGADTAQALGVRLGLLRVAIFAGACVMTGATVAATGPIGFVGLMAPNIARLLIGHDFRVLVPLSAALGAALLLASDILSRAVAFPSETPAGAVTALVGAPFFLLLARNLK